METKTVSVQIKTGPEDGLGDGEFLVYPSTFTRTPDAYGDVVAPGAFADAIADWDASGNVLPALYGHRMDDPDFYVGGAIEQSEDDHGWLVKGKFDLESPKGPTVYKLVKERKLTQLSFAYDVVEAEEVELEDGTKANELRKVKTYEFSFVPVGANQDTSVVAIKTGAEALAVARKVGRTLSAHNESDIREAVELLSGVLSSLDDDGKERDALAVKDPPDEDPEIAGKSDEADEPRRLSTLASLAIRERKAVR